MKSSDSWFRLDTAGNLYPAIESLSYPAMFRFAVRLKEPVDPARLEKAIGIVINRFPMLRVRLRRSLFWYYLEENNAVLPLRRDTRYPCRRLNRSRNHNFLIQVFYRSHTIAVEYFHALTDGTGAIIFLKTLAAEYLKLCGIDIPPGNGVLDCSQPALPEESENAFLRYYRGRKKRKVKESPVYHISGTVLPRTQYHTITGILRLEDLQQEARKYGVTITVYLAAVYIYAMYRHQEHSRRFKKKLAIKVSIPLNLRKYYPSRTLRNFSLFITPGIYPELGDYSFEEVLHHMHHEIRYELSEKYISAAMSANVSLEVNRAVRLVPLFIKNLVMNIIYRNFGENRFSGTLSNIGLIETPKSMEEQIDHFTLLLPPNVINPVNCSVATFNGKVTITFGRTIAEPEFERLMFTHFIKSGIPVTIYTNDVPDDAIMDHSG